MSLRPILPVSLQITGIDRYRIRTQNCTKQGNKVVHGFKVRRKEELPSSDFLMVFSTYRGYARHHSPMQVAALIPFLILFLGFAGLRLPLTYASFYAMLSGTLLTGTLFRADAAVWSRATQKTIILTFEIGFILIGAFFFLEMARKSGVIDSLARLVRAITPNRVVQGILVSFPLALMVEGSSGFGTPTLVIAPILMALHFELKWCALLPFLSCVVGIPYGALGTPTRLGFPDASPAHEIFLHLVPLMVIAPLISARLIAGRWQLKELLWTLSLSGVYIGSGVFISQTGPELSALGPAFVTFVYGLWSARQLFGDSSQTDLEWKGLSVYGLLLICMWAGKSIWMDRRFEGSEIRIFNPGMVFILFGLLMIPTVKRLHSLRAIVLETAIRSRKTLFVFFCTTFLVQQLRVNGSLEVLTGSLPSFWLREGAPVIGFLGSIFVGTSTMSNLLLSKVVEPAHFAALAAGSAVGVPLAFQSIVAVRSILHDQIGEKEAYLRVGPIGIGFLIVVLLGAFGIRV